MSTSYKVQIAYCNTIIVGMNNQNYIKHQEIKEQ